MKYVESKISGQGNEVYCFWLGKEELVALQKVLVHYHKSFQKSPAQTQLKKRNKGI